MTNEDAYNAGEDSGYADWCFAMKEAFDIDVDGPWDAVAKLRDKFGIPVLCDIQADRDVGP